MPEGLGFKARISYAPGPGFWCTVFGRPKVIKEFHTEIDEVNKEITTWIPSEVGKNIEISWKRVENQEFDIIGHAYADGVCLGGIINTSAYQYHPSVLRAVTTSKKTCRRIYFSPRDVSKTLRDESVLDEVGEIKLVIREAAVGAKVPVPPYDVQANDGAHEDLKKGIVHVAGFSPEKKHKIKWYDVTTHKVLVTFRFKYRPMDVLKADGIVSTSEKYRKK